MKWNFVRVSKFEQNDQSTKNHNYDFVNDNKKQS